RYLALPILKAGAYPKEIVEHTKLAKSTVNNATSALVTRELVADVPGKAGALAITKLGRDHLQALDESKNPVQKPTEPRPNAPPLNWVVAFGPVRKNDPLVRESSPDVRSEFGPAGSSSFGPSFLKEGPEPNQPNQNEANQSGTSQKQTEKKRPQRKADN